MNKGLLLIFGISIGVRAALAGTPEQNSSLVKAARDRNPNISVVDALLKAGADANSVDAETKAPLIFGVIRDNSAAVIEVLLKSGANINSRDENGNTPLMVATGEAVGERSGSKALDVLTLLLKNGADVNSSLKNGGTALFMALSGHPILENRLLEVLKILVDRGADVNRGVSPRKDLIYDTPLTFSVKIKRTDVVRFLISHGADPNQKTVSGTALSIARENGVAELVTLLEASGAK